MRTTSASAGRTVNPDDPLGAALAEVNALAETLHHQRLGAVEATALLRTVMEQIDVAVFAFDPTQHLRIANRTGERLMNRTVEQMLGRTAEELGVTDWFGESPRVVDITEAGGARGRWEVRRTTFRLGGLPHDLLVLSDVSRPLREQERQAWQRLIRVIGHELGNSLGPIKSIAGSLETLLQRDPPPSDWRDDMQRGLQVIASRTDSLSRFTGAYARLARLPAPRPVPIVLKPFLQRLAGLETRLPIQFRPGPDVTIAADPDQLEQLLINLLRNARRRHARDGRRHGHAGLAARCGTPSKSGWTTRDRDCRIPPTCSCRSSRPSPADRASASCSAARSPRRTRDRYGSKTARDRRGCRALLALPA